MANITKEFLEAVERDETTQILELVPEVIKTDGRLYDFSFAQQSRNRNRLVQMLEEHLREYEKITREIESEWREQQKMTKRIYDLLDERWKYGLALDTIAEELAIDYLENLLRYLTTPKNAEVQS